MNNISNNKHNKRSKHKKRNKHVVKYKKTNIHITTYLNQIIPIFFKKISDADGCCYNPNCKNPRIIVDKRLLTRRKLNVIIEEITHAFFWDLPEYKVRKFSAQLGKVLYHLFIKS